MPSLPHNSVVIALDFDGVLHTRETEKFVGTDLLAPLLTEFPYVRIVISSSWREAFSIEELIDFLGPIGHLVVGVIPTISGAKRQQEIEQWVQENSCPNILAIDDDRSEFLSDCEWVEFVNPLVGINQELIDRLRVRFSTEFSKERIESKRVV